MSNAPASFQRAMDNLFGPEWQPYVFIYIDDIVIATNNFKEHLYWLEKVLKKLKKVGLKINREKSEFGCPEIRFLGYIANKYGLRTDPEKTRAVLEYPAPKNFSRVTKLECLEVLLAIEKF